MAELSLESKKMTPSPQPFPTSGKGGRWYIPIGFQGAGKASAPVSSGAYIEVGEQRNQADYTVQNIRIEP